MTPLLSAADFSFHRITWQTEVLLSSWAGFQSRGGGYASRDQECPSDGRAGLCIIHDPVTDTPLTRSGLVSANWVLSHEEEVSVALLRQLVPEYSRLRARWAARYRGDNFDAIMPAVSAADDFKILMGLSVVYVHPPLRDGVGCAGFLFGCIWDPEHGAGVLMRGTSLVGFGGADVAFCPPADDDPLSE